ncbi:hypothetical protein OG21DRAFT_1527722 [Imleria badia]|nr:hypothetical protein OG21DRAFT_1527722 [Imleria badia]
MPTPPPSRHCLCPHPRTVTPSPSSSSLHRRYHRRPHAIAIALPAPSRHCPRPHPRAATPHCHCPRPRTIAPSPAVTSLSFPLSSRHHRHTLALTLTLVLSRYRPYRCAHTVVALPSESPSPSSLHCPNCDALEFLIDEDADLAEGYCHDRSLNRSLPRLTYCQLQIGGSAAGIEEIGLYGKSNVTAAANHLQITGGIRAGILDLVWDALKLAFYAFNLTSNARNSVFTVVTFYPYGPPVSSPTRSLLLPNAFGYFSAVNMVTNKYNGTSITFVDWTGLQWQYILTSALEALPSNLKTNALRAPDSGQSTYDLVPSGQLNFTEAQLPRQPYHDNENANVIATSPSVDINRLNGTVVNGGNATAEEGWAATLKREMADSEYVSAGFANGVVLWVTANYGHGQLFVALLELPVTEATSRAHCGAAGLRLSLPFTEAVVVAAVLVVRGTTRTGDAEKRVKFDEPLINSTKTSKQMGRRGVLSRPLASGRRSSYPRAPTGRYC